MVEGHGKGYGLCKHEKNKNTFILNMFTSHVSALSQNGATIHLKIQCNPSGLCWRKYGLPVSCFNENTYFIIISTR